MDLSDAYLTEDEVRALQPSPDALADAQDLFPELRRAAAEISGEADPGADAAGQVLSPAIRSDSATSQLILAIDGSLNQGKPVQIELSASDLRSMTRMITEEGLRVTADPRGDSRAGEA